MLRSTPAPGPTWLCCRCTRVAPQRPALRLRAISAASSPGTDEPPPDGVGARKPRGPLSAETRTKQSAAAKNRTHSTSTRELLAAAHAGKKKAFAERPKSRGSVRSAETRQLMSERIRAAWARRKASEINKTGPGAVQPASSVKDGALMTKALGRSLHEWTTAQLRAAVRGSGLRISHPGPPKTELFKLLTSRLGAPGVATGLALGSGRQRRARDVSKGGQRRTRSASRSNDAIAAIAAPPPADADATTPVPAMEAAAVAVPAAVPPAPAGAAISQKEKQAVLATALAEFLDATAGVRPLSSLFGEEILSEDGVGFLLAEGNVQDANTVAKFLRLKARFQELGE